MITKKLISKEIQTITLEYSGAEALAIMQEYHLSHLAILHNNELLGVISEEDIWGMHDESNKLNSIKEKIQHFFMPLGKDVFEVIMYIISCCILFESIFIKIHQFVEHMPLDKRE